VRELAVGIAADEDFRVHRVEGCIEAHSLSELSSINTFLSPGTSGHGKPHVEIVEMKDRRWKRSFATAARFAGSTSPRGRMVCRLSMSMASPDSMRWLGLRGWVRVAGSDLRRASVQLDL